ncbi:hypothetical protein PINS_up012086 [Pythium insidiosum]|nr:hypothetical protein PINS_up012086 [Pythium insidiosum]
MKFLCVIGAALVSALALAAPAQAAQCTPDQAVEAGSALVGLSLNPDCATVEVKESTKDLCKFPKCAAAFQAKLTAFPDCEAEGKNVRAQIDKATKCSSSSAVTLSVAGAALATALAAVIV